jgi:hypothetical protein
VVLAVKRVEVVYINQGKYGKALMDQFWMGSGASGQRRGEKRGNDLSAIAALESLNHNP